MDGETVSISCVISMLLYRDQPKNGEMQTLLALIQFSNVRTTASITASTSPISFAPMRSTTDLLIFNFMSGFIRLTSYELQAINIDYLSIRETY